MLNQFDYLPSGFLQAGAQQMLSVLPGPSLIHLPGRREQPVFASLMLHGNEDVGLRAVQNLLQFYGDKPLPRALSIFVGNLAAARLNVRRLPDQPDYNRVWPGHENMHGPEADMTAKVTEIMRQRRCFISVDFHNNTGLNPYYALINRLDPALLRLAVMFNRTIVYTLRPNGTQAMAFLPFCAALTIECGKVGDQHGIRRATEFLQAVMELGEIGGEHVRNRDFDLFHSLAVVKVPSHYTISVGGQADIRFREGLDFMNFQELAANTVIAELSPGSNAEFDVRDERGAQVYGQFFMRDGDRIVLRKPVIPAMLTLDLDIVRQDCLCYLMLRLETIAGLS